MLLFRFLRRRPARFKRQGKRNAAGKFGNPLGAGKRKLWTVSLSEIFNRVAVRVRLVLVYNCFTIRSKQDRNFLHDPALSRTALYVPGMMTDETLEDWRRACVQVRTPRQMYHLAERVSASPVAPMKHQRAARRVVKLLKPVIDKPIAKAELLAAARRRFENLVSLMNDS